MKFNVPDMSCGHCTSAIEKAIKQADADASVSCDLENRSVSVESGLPREMVSDILKKAGYESSAAE